MDKNIPGGEKGPYKLKISKKKNEYENKKKGKNPRKNLFAKYNLLRRVSFYPLPQARRVGKRISNCYFSPFQVPPITLVRLG